MKLDAAWLNWPETRQLHHAFTAAGFELRFVGGCVRDTILNRKIDELDAATNALPSDSVTLLEKAGIKAIPTGIDHGTITAVFPSRSIEITTLRNDIATDGRHAEVAFTEAWEEDAKRRDFTVNALYVAADGTFYDPLGGLEDCKAGYVRFIGDATARIREDYLRILRYFRFVATVGNNHFDPAALAACMAGKQGIASLSGERIRQELLKLLAAKKAHVATQKLLPLLPAPLSFLQKQQASLEALESLDANDGLLKLAALIGDSAEIPAVVERLKLSGKQVKLLETWLTHVAAITPAMTELAQKKVRRKLGAENYRATIQLAAAFAGDTSFFTTLAPMGQWQPPEFPISANDLMTSGFQEGKALGDALRMLEHAWEDSNYTLSREELLTRLR